MIASDNGVSLQSAKNVPKLIVMMVSFVAYAFEVIAKKSLTRSES